MGDGEEGTGPLETWVILNPSCGLGTDGFICLILSLLPIKEGKYHLPCKS